MMTAMRKRWPEDAYAVLGQVRSSTGATQARTADALVFSLWPSRGLTIDGVEVKRSLPDYRREAKDPAKAVRFARHCHRWWIAAPKGLIPPDELPAQWGLLELQGNGTLRARVGAPENADPEPMPLTMWMAVMRNLQRRDAQQLRDIQRAEREEARRTIGEMFQAELDQYRATFEEIRQATGTDPRYSVKRLTEAVEFWRAHQKDVELDRRHQQAAQTLRRVAENLTRLADEMTQQEET